MPFRERVVFTRTLRVLSALSAARPTGQGAQRKGGSSEPFGRRAWSAFEKGAPGSVCPCEQALMITWQRIDSTIA